MYDKLGDLLNETLENGEIKFVKIDRENLKEPFENPSGSGFEKTSADDERVRMWNFRSLDEEIPKSEYDEKLENEKARKFNECFSRRENTGTVFHADSDFAHNVKIYEPANNFVIKKITPQVQDALNLFELESSCSFDDVKRRYKEQVKHYHPDHYAGNPELEKIAAQKTSEVLDAYNVLTDFFTE